MATLLQELGGPEAVELVVAAFYEKVMADPLLKGYFRGVQMSKLYKNQADFFCAALGQPDAYRGRDMRTVHAGMNIGDAEFDAVAVHLSNALSECGVGKAHVDQVIGLIAPLRADVVTRKPDAAAAPVTWPKAPAAAACPMHAAGKAATAWLWPLVALAVVLAALAGVVVWHGGPLVR
jgi:hemoglobin